MNSGGGGGNHNNPYYDALLDNGKDLFAGVGKDDGKRLGVLVGGIPHKLPHNKDKLIDLSYPSYFYGGGGSGGGICDSSSSLPSADPGCAPWLITRCGDWVRLVEYGKVLMNVIKFEGDRSRRFICVKACGSEEPAFPVPARWVVEAHSSSSRSSIMDKNELFVTGTEVKDSLNNLSHVTKVTEEGVVLRIGQHPYNDPDFDYEITAAAADMDIFTEEEPLDNDAYFREHFLSFSDFHKSYKIIVEKPRTSAVMIGSQSVDVADYDGPFKKPFLPPPLKSGKSVLTKKSLTFTPPSSNQQPKRKETPSKRKKRDVTYMEFK